MRCPKCKNLDTKVIDSRMTEDGQAIRRRRECEKCEARFTTLERLEFINFLVTKSNGEKDLYDRSKLQRSVMMAFNKRNIDHNIIEQMINELENEWASNKKGITSIPDNNFSLIIPQIDINTKVIPLVDLADENATQKALKTGVVQAKGSSSPGQLGTIYIFGHSTDSPWHIKLYNAIFYPLKDVEEGSEIIIIYEGNPFIYQVEEKKIISANDLQYLTNPSEKEKLILLTCWPPGTTLKRLLIVAIRT